MIERYLVVAARIRQEMEALERVVQRTERAFVAAQQHAEDQDLFLDAVALNLHDFYSGMERIFHHIAATLDRSVPSAPDWHRELLRQMQVELSQIRPHVLSAESVRSLDEFLRFRHVEYDTPRAGYFRPLQYVQPETTVVLGLLTTKQGTLEDAGAVETRIREATQYIPLERLAVSPQCGFASGEAGNPLTPEEQEAKLHLVGHVARQVWQS